MLHVLADGTRLRLRFIEPGDKALLAGGIERLSPRSRHDRFLAPKSALSVAELRYLTEVDGHDHVAIVAVLEEDPSTLAGVARYVRSRERPTEADVAFVVADGLQGRGLGRTLGLALADVARGHGVRRFTASLLGGNVAAERLFASIARRVSTEYEAGTAELIAELETREHPILAGWLAARGTVVGPGRLGRITPT
jgi:GNAT superfamily N-acetyltransferase